jgi:putative ABC transport system permease protein
MRSDVVAAIRSLTGAKTFTAVAIVVLAIGIGASSAIYSVADAVMFRQLPFADADRLVTVKESRPPASPDEAPPVLPQNFLDWDAQQDVFDALAAVTLRRVTVMDAGASAPEDLLLLRTTADFFDVIRFAPVLGRTFGREHEDDRRSKVIVLTHVLWQTRYGGDSAIVGRTITLDHEPYEVIGVLASEAAYRGGSVRGAQAIVPYVVPAAERVRMAGVSASYLSTVARLKPGTSLAQAQAQMDQIAASLRAEHPSWNENHHVRVAPLLDEFVNTEWRRWLWLLLGAAGVTLLIACVNVALLQLARAATREHEMSVRASLGAGRWRVIRQLLVENVLLAMMGTAAAVAVASGGVAVLKAAIPSAMPRLDEVHVDLRVLAVMTAVALVAASQ